MFTSGLSVSNSYIQIDVDDITRVETLETATTLGDSTYIGFGPSTEMSCELRFSLVSYSLVL